MILAEFVGIGDGSFVQLLQRERELALNTWAGTLPTTKACLRLPEKHRFVDFDTHQACLQDALCRLRKDTRKTF